MTTIAKMIQLLHKMETDGLWITYVKAEEAENHLRTPRKSKVDSFKDTDYQGPDTHKKETQNESKEKQREILVVPSSQSNNFSTVNF